METFKQKRFFNTKRIQFKEDGINYYSGNFLNSREIFIPFEEILIDNYTRESKTNTFFLWVAISSLILLTIALLNPFSLIFSQQLILLSTFSFLFITFTVITILTQKNTLYMSTFSGFLIDFYDCNPSEEKFSIFLDSFSKKIKTYLKHKLSIIDEDISFEKHLENFNYLKDRKIITQTEYENLKEKLKNIEPNVKGFKY